MDASVLTFLGISAAVIVTPGPDTALTVRNTFLGGLHGGILTAVGVSAGQVVWSVGTSLGLLAVLLTSESVFHALKLFGAAYLGYLGVQSLRAAFRGGPPRGSEPPRDARGRLGGLAAFRQGLLNNLANPKMAVFFASVLPQFAPPGHGMLSIRVYDDFAHHPTAVSETLRAVRQRYPRDRIWAVFEPRSQTCRRKIFEPDFITAFDPADAVVIARAGAFVRGSRVRRAMTVRPGWLSSGSASVSPPRGVSA